MAASPCGLPRLGRSRGSVARLGGATPLPSRVPRHPLLAGPVCLCLLLILGCSDRGPEVRRYREIETAVLSPRHDEDGAPDDAPPPVGPIAPAGAARLRWDAPEGWVEQPGSGMRLATFLVGPDRQECTLLRFPGTVGGAEANVARWLGQLGAEVPDHETLRAFIDAGEVLNATGRLPGRLLDLDSLIPPGEDQTGMLAAMLTPGDFTVFVKLTGPRALLRAELPRFRALCLSLRNPA